MLDKRIKIRHIQVFVEIARVKSLKRAAENLHLTQPAISKTLRELEDLLGANLMERSRAGVSLTGAGEAFLHFAQISMASLQRGYEGVQSIGQRERERLRLGALPSVAAWLMPKVIREFAALAPNALLQIVDGPHGYLTDRLKLGALDLVIGRLGEPDTMAGLTFTQFYSEEIDFVTRPGHPLHENPDLQRIGDWQVLFPPEGSAIRPLVDRYLIANGVGEIPNRLETVSGAFGRVYTRQSDAVWIISRGVVANEYRESRLVRLPFPADMTQGPVGLMTRADAPVTDVLSLFTRAFQKTVDQVGQETQPGVRQ